MGVRGVEAGGEGAGQRLGRWVWGGGEGVEAGGEGAGQRLGRWVWGGGKGAEAGGQGAGQRLGRWVWGGGEGVEAGGEGRGRCERQKRSVTTLHAYCLAQVTSHMTHSDVRHNNKSEPQEPGNPINTPTIHPRGPYMEY